MLLLLSRHGEILARQPMRTGQGGIGSDLSQNESFQRIFAQEAGSFAARAAIDPVTRYYTFARVPNQSLIVAVGLATADIFADWWWRSLATGALTLVACAIILLFAVLLRRELQRRARVQARLARLSVTDGLTGLDNRRRYDEVMEHEWRRASRTGSPLSLLMLDIDRFKRLNDTYGHATGDEVLKELARIVEAHIHRPADLGARYGGEEFAVVLPETDGPGAMSVAEAIRVHCEQASGDLPKFTVSIGVNTTRPSSGVPLAPFQAAADKALYRAKEEGRNRVVLAE